MIGNTSSEATAKQFLPLLLDEHHRLGRRPRRTYKEALERSTHDHAPTYGSMSILVEGGSGGYLMSPFRSPPHQPSLGASLQPSFPWSRDRVQNHLISATPCSQGDQSPKRLTILTMPTA
jgi:hypothetical protein